MKSILQFIIVLLTVILFSNCKDASTSPQDSTQYYSVSGIVFDVVSNDYSPGIKRGAPIYIDNDSMLSGNDGTFIFNNVSEGHHTVKVNLSNYEPFSETISLRKDTNVVIYLYGIKADYFPIKENSQIKFNYSYRAFNSVNSIYFAGKSFWNIYSSKVVNDTIVYEAVETLIFTRGRSDTLTTHFTISEDSSKVVTINLHSDMGTIYVYFKRYLDARLDVDDKIIYSTIISLKKNVGVIKIQQSGYNWQSTYELIE